MLVWFLLLLSTYGRMFSALKMVCLHRVLLFVQRPPLLRPACFFQKSGCFFFPPEKDALPSSDPFEPRTPTPSPFFSFLDLRQNAPPSRWRVSKRFAPGLRESRFGRSLVERKGRGRSATKPPTPKNNTHPKPPPTPNQTTPPSTTPAPPPPPPPPPPFPTLPVVSTAMFFC